MGSRAAVRLCLAALANVAAPVSSAPALAATNERPNIVVVLADDMGYSDIGAYGGEIRTPNLDRLAREGLRFRTFYNNAKCSPSRASLLTGLYPHQAGLGDLADGTPGEPGPYQGYLSERSVTLAEALRAAGYRTYMSGKWHLGDEPRRWPRQRGFDRFFGLISGATSYYELLPEPGRVRQMALDDEPWRPKGDAFYATDAYADHAVERIREHRSAHAGRPFFLYLAFTAPHFPLHAPEADVARYTAQYEAGWDALRAARHAAQRRLGILDERFTLAPRPASVPAWADAQDKTGWVRRMAVYAAMVDRMDQGVGRVLRALDETGAAANTLVVFLSDNGGTAEDVAGRRLHDPGVTIGAPGSYAAYLEPWAQLSNTPFRLYKNWLHEGGIATPLVVWWPRGLRRPGRVSTEVGHLVDLAPTLLELARAPHPAEREGRPTLPLEGRSLAPVLRDEPLPARSAPLFWAYGGHWAVRDGEWKLVYDGRAKQLGLFDLATDPTELHDLSGREPGRLAELRAQWLSWAERVSARERLELARSNVPPSRAQP